jgi:hypothetical protein
VQDNPLGLQGRPFPYDVKTTADHWWPKGLQRLWRDQAGCISLIRPSGEVKSGQPPKKGSGKKGFAQKRGGHKMHFGLSPWNHTFEPEFDEVDNAGPLILRRMDKQLQGEDQGLLDPTVVAITTDTLIKLCFSLMVRSPAFRYRYSYAGKSFGVGYNEETGKANVEHFWGSARNIDLNKCNSGELLLLHSENAEFCFGDGLCDTIFARPISWHPKGVHWVADLSGEAFIPLLPNLCAYLHFSRGDCGTKTNVIQVTSNVVDEVNALTQVYSKEQLFFRSIKPALTPEYMRREHSIVSREHQPFHSALRALIS